MPSDTQRLLSSIVQVHESSLCLLLWSAPFVLRAASKQWDVPPFISVPNLTPSTAHSHCTGGTPQFTPCLAVDIEPQYIREKFHFIHVLNPWRRSVRCNTVRLTPFQLGPRKTSSFRWIGMVIRTCPYVSVHRPSPSRNDFQPFSVTLPGDGP